MTHPSLWSYIANADWIVKFVILLLVAASIASWTFIFQRRNVFKNTQKSIQQFDREFQTTPSANELCRRISAHAKGLLAMLRDGYHTFELLKDRDCTQSELLEGVKRSMQSARQEQIDQLETHLGFLATVGSVSPYVGLFGTVWGIIAAFQALGTVQQASIAMVAPGISEALIATAIGLFAAIPAVIAYNRFSQSLDKIDARLERFENEFLTRLQKDL